MDEKELYKIGEELAIAAAKADVGSKQLRDLYKISKTQALPRLEAYVKRQIVRSSKKEKSSPKGFDKFGPVMLSTMESFGDDKAGLTRALEYANYLHDWEKLKIAKDMYGQDSTTELKKKIEPLVKRQSSKFVYDGIYLEEDGRQIRCKVLLRRFSGNPAQFASELYREVVSHYPELSGSIRFWIEKA